MIFPKINYKYNGLKEAQLLTTLVDQKFESFKKFFHDGESVTCDVEFEKVTHQQHGQIYRVEVNVMVGGVLYRAEATEDSFEKAIDEVREELDKELSRSKDKHVDLNIKAAREAKEKFLNGND